MKNPMPVPLDQEEETALTTIILQQPESSDDTVSQGAWEVARGIGNHSSKGVQSGTQTLDIFAIIAKGSIPTYIRELLVTGQIMTQDKDEIRVRPMIIPIFMIRISISAIGGS